MKNRIKGCAAKALFEWIKVFCNDKQTKRYHEQDLVAHVLLPLLNYMGYDTVTPGTVSLDFRDGKSERRPWDINIYRGSELRPDVVFEVKTNKFSSLKWVASDEWFPILFEKDWRRLEQYFSPVQKSLKGNGELPKEDRKISDCIAESIERSGDRSVVDCQNKFQKFFEKAIGMPEAERNKALCNLARDMECASYFVASFASNDYATDGLGELWRYVHDGRHIFAPQYTVPILTNGFEWIVIHKSFLSKTQWPVIRWDKESDQMMPTECAAYFRIPNPEGRFTYKWIKEVEEILNDIRNDIRKTRNEVMERKRSEYYG